MGNLVPLSARDVSLALTDPFGLWNKHHGDQKLKDAEDEFAQFLKEQGLRSERKLLELRHKSFVSLKDKPFESAADQTEDLLKINRSVIYGGAIQSEQLRLRARPDVIEVHDEAYLIEEYKLASKPDDADKIQALFYAYLMRKGYGIASDCKIVTRNNEEFVIPYEEGYIEEAINYAREILSSDTPPHPVYNCQSEWGILQNQKATDLQDVSLATNVGPTHAKKLHQMGVHTLKDLAGTSPDFLKAIKGLGPKKVPQILDSARAQVTQRVLKVGAWSPVDDPVDLEIFIDLEGSGELFQDDPSWDCIYLIGFIPRSSGKQGAYTSYVARRPSDERSIISEFLEYLRKEVRSYRLYHWHHYEKTQLKKACERHGMTDAYQSLVLPHLSDLYKAAQDAFVLPIPTWSIKGVAPYFGFKWTQDTADVDAMKSAMIWYKQAADGGSGAGLDKVLQYNKDDCTAMIVVKDAFDRLDKGTS